MNTITRRNILITTVVAASLLLLVSARKRTMERTKKRRARKQWTKNWLQQRQSSNNVLHLLNKELLVEDPASYRNFLRLTNNQFKYVLDLIRNDIAKKDTFMRNAVSAQTRLEVTLRFLATGESYRSLMYSTRIHESTISLFVSEVCQAIYKNLKPMFLQTPRNQDDWQKIADDFYMLWQFPNCLGALDAKHINFRAPISEGSYYFNYKGFNSIVLLGMCDARYKFTYVNVGINGRVSDGGIFQLSNLNKAMHDSNNPLHFPDPKPLPGQNTNVPYVIIADDAFPLRKHLLKPYSSRGLTHDQKVFNYRLSRARRMIESAYGILANRFKIFLAPINLSAEKVEMITLACIVLHNYLASSNGTHYTDIASEEKLDNLISVGRQGGNHSSKDARETRDQYALFFNTDGAVEWQEQAISRSNF